MLKDDLKTINASCALSIRSLSATLAKSSQWADHELSSTVPENNSTPNNEALLLLLLTSDVAGLQNAFTGVSSG